VVILKIQKNFWDTANQRFVHKNYKNNSLCQKISIEIFLANKNNKVKIMRECQECKKPMKKISSMNSSNAIIETWECQECGWKKEICTGLKL